MKEIEKKYLVKEIPNLDNVLYIDIEQSYLNISPDPILRLRKYGNEYFLTYKSKIENDKKVYICNEYELPISLEVYNKLLKNVESKIIKKRRYKIDLENNLTAELDIYDGFLKGFMNVEVEFKSIEESIKFIKPSWFGEDISGIKKYTNSSLSLLNDASEILKGK